MKAGIKLHEWFRHGGKVPRKTKKYVIGTKMKRGDLRKLLASVSVIEGARTMYDTAIIEPHAFCPECGETRYVGTGNRAEYPEHWEDFHCVRCRSIVAYIDNSPFIHALECEDFTV